jgi:rod shape-determining protein MreC
VRDKQVRRRRAVLGLLVVLSLILLTAYFGESTSSPLHRVQQGLAEVLSPIQEGASKALKPFRNLAGDVSSTLHAKSQVAKLQAQVANLESQLATANQKAINYNTLAAEVGLDTGSFSQYHPVTANVIGRAPSLWYQTITVDKGSDDGVQAGDPVTWDGALVGKVSYADATISGITLITDHTFAVAAEVQDSVGDEGLLVPVQGNPQQLVLQNLSQTPPFHEQAKQLVVTAGFSYGSLTDLYPPGIPIGVVTSANQDQLLNTGQIDVSPSADLSHLYAVQILTTPHPGTERAMVP